MEMEPESWRLGTHPPGCGCLPCRLSRSWVSVERDGSRLRVSSWSGQQLRRNPPGSTSDTRG